MIAPARVWALAIVCALVALAPPTARAGDDVPGFAAVSPSLALIGFPLADKTVAFGTGFCVTSNATTSYFVTNNHVVQGPDGNPSSHLFAMFAGSTTHYAAHVVRHSGDPDLAIVAVDLGNVPPVKISGHPPEAGDHIAIAGFPFVESVDFAGLWGKDSTLSNVHAPTLVPLLTDGHVNAMQTGSYYILYDAKTDHGNSGGPLFDAQNGAVYGVVAAAVDGYSENDLPARVQYNLAIAMSEGLTFIDAAPVKVAIANASGGQIAEHAYTASAHGSKGCLNAWRDLDRAYGLWAQAHGTVGSLAAFAVDGQHLAQLSRLRSAAPIFAAHEATQLAAMQSALSAMQRSHAPTIAEFANRLVAAAASSTPLDRALSADLTAPAAASAVKAASGPLEDAAAQMDSISSCE